MRPLVSIYLAHEGPVDDLDVGSRVLDDIVAAIVKIQSHCDELQE